MHRESILSAVPCDVRELPLAAVDAFILSHVDGRSTVEELADLAGMGLGDVTRVARRLLELGAVAVLNEPRASKTPSSARSSAPPTRTQTSTVPRAKESMRAPRPKESVRPARASEGAPRPKESVRPARASEACDLPDDVRARILELDARVDGLDHYALLGVERDAPPKAIKRAYYALAAKFHPDRFFGKKLGPLRAPLERVFVRITRAHDTLVDRTERAAYDVTLPPAPATSKKPPPRTSSAPARPSSAPKPTKTPAPPRPPSRRMSAVTPSKSPPRPPSRRMSAVATSKSPPRPPSRRMRALAAAAAAAKSAPPPPSSRDAKAVASDALRRMYAGGVSEVQRQKKEFFVKAAEDAMAKDDVVAAANHYRLAVQISDDPETRALLEQVDAKAKARTFDVSVARGKAEEQAQRWDQAAAAYAKAHAMKAEAWLAERGANALRRAGGDLRRAAQLAEQAVLAEPRNAAFRMTLGEVYLAAGLLARAAGEAARALSIAPEDPRAKALSGAVTKAREPKT